ncbi:MAG TPA: sugar transferase [Alphaproteobacteria bacterium]|nr:sugar transferase [Alphaproteobacteria bacterium]
MTDTVMNNVPSNVVLNHNSWALAFKRFIDVFCALSALFLLWPILFMIAISVKITSPGPVLYRGLRGGYHWKSFRILKFRTMVHNAESLGGPTTGTNDPRVTNLGRFLRRTKLDELPQIINILVGDMSFVGPRPEVLKYTSRYDGEERLILEMRPGITDYSSMKFADLDDRVGSDDPDAYFQQHILPEKNRLRVKYVKEWSLTGDFKILYETLWVVIKRVFLI